MDKAAIEKIRADYGRYLAINRRRKTSGYENHGIWEAIQLETSLIAAIPDLLDGAEMGLRIDEEMKRHRHEKSTKQTKLTDDEIADEYGFPGK